MTILLKNNIKYFFGAIKILLIIIFISNSYLNAQSVKKDTIYHTPFDTNKISNSYILDIQSDTIGKNDFIWSDRRNLSEILNDKAGYIINYLGIGGRNPINFNNFDDRQIGIFRDGVQINDYFFGGFDEENISVSEIQKIEEVSNISSFLYGMNSSGKALNIITKDAFQPTLFSQLRYSQDRYGALFADFSLNIPLSKKFNFIFGINSHFTDGYYQNSDFNVWRGRMKLNFYSSPKFNIKTSFYYTKINRRLNYGLVYTTDDTLKNPNFAEVNSLGTYERMSNYYFDISSTANFFNDKNSLTKFTFNTNNSYRIYRNGENGVDPGVFTSRDFHSICYNFDLKQYYNRKFSNNFKTNILIGGKANFNLFNFLDPFALSRENNNPISSVYKNIYSGIGKIDFLIDKLFLSGSYKVDFADNNIFNQSGIEGKYKLLNSTDYGFTIKGGINSTLSKLYYLWYYGSTTYHNISYFSNTGKTYVQIGFEAHYKNLYLDAYQYGWDFNSAHNNSYFSNGNYSVNLYTKYFDFGINTNYSSFDYFPSFFIKPDIVYHNFLFKDKLDLRIGISAKYFSNTLVYAYNQLYYLKNPYYPSASFVKKDFFNVDFYIGARIGTANVNFTIANLFDNLNYTTAIYPYDARGGFLNSIARFTIVWDFNR